MPAHTRSGSRTSPPKPRPARISSVFRRGFCIVAAAGVAMSCTERSPGQPAACDADAARDVVLQFGTRLQRVSLLAPDSIVRDAIRDAYAPFVTLQLLESWLSAPDSAPGRRVSSPWPDHIVIDSVAHEQDGACVIRGTVVFATSADQPSGESGVREPFVARVVNDDEWRITDYSAQSADTPNAIDVIRGYYAAIAAHDYERAYALWSDYGAASGQTLADFEAGFAQTDRVSVEIGDPGRIEGAAGSRYVTVPVVIRAVTTGGEPQQFEGTYTLRRSVVPGATEDQRRWRIHSAEIVASQ